jgi:hypothetical protein
MNEYDVTVIEYGAIVTLRVKASDEAKATTLALRTQGVTQVLRVSSTCNARR